MTEPVSHDRIAEHLDALLAAGPKKRKTKAAELLDIHEGKISKLLAQGHSANAIHSALTNAGVKISGEAIRKYVSTLSKPKAKKP